MDYKYIEQLLDRYWQCATSPEEESILRAFFSQKEMPAELEKYKSLFVYENAQAKLHLDESFDERVLAAAGIAEEEEEKPSTKVVKIGHVTLATRLRPLFRAAAAVAIVTLLAPPPSTPSTARTKRPQVGTTTDRLTRTPTTILKKPTKPE